MWSKLPKRNPTQVPNPVVRSNISGIGSNQFQVGSDANKSDPNTPKGKPKDVGPNPKKKKSSGSKKNKTEVQTTNKPLEFFRAFYYLIFGKTNRTLKMEEIRKEISDYMLEG